MKKLKSKFIFISVVFGIIALAIGSYFWLIQKQTKSKEFTGVREKVRIGIALQLPSALTIIAAEKDFFSVEGLDVTLKEYPSGKKAMDGMLAGEVDIATTAETPIVFNSFKRNDFSIIATIGSIDNVLRVVARKDRKIQKPIDLKGKHIGAQQTSASYFFLHMFLIKHGLSEQDVQISFHKVEEMPKTLARGEIDAFSLREPFISEAKKLLGDNVIVFTEPGLYLWMENLIALNSFIKTKPEVLKRILCALIRAKGFENKFPDQAIKLIAKKMGVSESEISTLWRDLNLKVSLEQAILLTLEDKAQWAINNKLTDKTKIPNYLDFIYLDGLKAVKPEAVTIIR